METARSPDWRGRGFSFDASWNIFGLSQHSCYQSAVSIEKVILTINAMQADGVIGPYAIGGAVGATFYLEPVATLDIDIFVAFQAEPGQMILSPQAIFGYLAGHGFVMQGEYVMIADWPVQFLPPTGPLVEEALREAVEKDLAGTPARVFTAEHLAAIALQTGRAKDKSRLLQFIEGGVLDPAIFRAILTRHRLDVAWERFQRQFRGDIP